MIAELTSNKEVQLNKWFRVREYNGNPVTGMYVRFAMAYDSKGNSLYKIPKADAPIFVIMEYNGNGYP